MFEAAYLAAIILSLACLVRPFWPLRTRRRALVALGVLFSPLVAVALWLPPPAEKAPGGEALQGAETLTTAVGWASKVSRERAQPTNRTSTGCTAIEVPTDRRATYCAVGASRNAAGNAVITSQRTGSSGVSYVVRECECPVSRYRVLGEGGTAKEAKSARRPRERMADLVYDGPGRGSISYHVCAYACR